MIEENSLNSDVNLFASEEKISKQYKDLMLYAIENYGVDILKKIEKNFLDNKGLMLEVVNIDGLALKYVSSRLKEDIDVVLAAMNNYFPSYIYVADELKQKPEFVFMVAKLCESFCDGLINSDQTKNVRTK